MTASSFFGQFDPSTDNIAVTGYELQHALDVPMTVDPTIVDIGNTIVGGQVQFNITGVEPDTEYHYRIRAYDAAGNFSDWSGIEFAHSDVEIAPYDPVAELGSALLVYLDAAEIAGSNGTILAAVPNYGMENDWDNAGTGNITLAVESGVNAVDVPLGAVLEGLSTTPALSQWTFYAVVKMNADYSNKYWFRSFKFSGSKVILVGFVDDNFEYYDTPRTSIGTVSTSAYQLVKCTIGTTAEGEWRSFSDGDTSGKFRVLIGVNRHLTSGEEADLETWLNTRLV